MAFTVTIATDNAAFCDADGEPDDVSRVAEVTRILRELADRMDESSADEHGFIRDSNGNRVGEWTVSGGPVHIIEAQCHTCGESFNPTGPNDLIHQVRENGDECGGPGEIRGTWG